MKKEVERKYKVEAIGKPNIENLSKTEKQILYSTLLNEAIKWKQEKNKDNKKLVMDKSRLIFSLGSKFIITLSLCFLILMKKLT